jgi:hypothetical protein
MALLPDAAFVGIDIGRQSTRYFTRPSQRRQGPQRLSLCGALTLRSRRREIHSIATIRGYKKGYEDDFRVRLRGNEEMGKRVYIKTSGGKKLGGRELSPSLYQRVRVNLSSTDFWLFYLGPEAPR